MKNFLFCFTFLFFMAPMAWAQDGEFDFSGDQHPPVKRAKGSDETSDENPFPRMKPNTVTISGTLQGELLLFYERKISKRFSVEVGFGKKYSFGDSVNVHEISDYGEFASYYSGYEYSLGGRYYAFKGKKHAWYISLLGFYKDYSYDHLSINYTFEPYNCKIQSSHKKVDGFKILVGRKFNFPVGKYLNFVFDVYAGTGLRQIKYNDEVYGSGRNPYGSSICTCSLYAVPYASQHTEIEPSIQLGAKLGIAF